MNKIAVIAMVKNEEDIIESFARHVCKFADILLIANHSSTDKTKFILESLQSENLPIKIFDLFESEYDHGKVLTEFLHRAIDEFDADIVIPLDADEFLIYKDGTSTDIRKFFQQLDINKSYQTRWIFYEIAEPDKDADKFLLSRKMYRESAENKILKCLVGRKVAKDFNLQFLKGGHITLYPDNTNFPQTFIDSKIFNAHFPKRSSGQILSKTMVGWLTHILKFGKYGRLSHDWKDDAEKFISSNTLPEYHVEKPVETDDFKNYADECVNRYTTGNMEPLKNLYRLGEKIAEENFRNKILSKNELVRIYVLFNGNVDDTLRSLQSALNQTYSHRKIFITATTEYNLNQLIKSTSNMKFSEEIELISADDPVIISARDGFTQFITAGDILDPDKIMNSVEAIYSDTFKYYFVTCMPKNSTQSSNSPVPFHVDTHFRCTPFNGYLVFDAMLDQDVYFTAGLSGFLFRQEILYNRSDLIPWLGTENVDSFQMFFLESLINIDPGVFYIKDELVTKNNFWTEKDRLMFEKVRASLALKHRGSEFLSEESYQHLRNDLIKFNINLPA